jgi:excisionase family DNA binding protein
MDIGIPQWYTISETAKILKLSRVTISRKISNKQIPFVRMGSWDKSKVLIPVSYFEALEAEALKAVE